MDEIDPQVLADTVVSNATDKVGSMVAGFGAAAPKIVLAVLVFLLFWLGARAASWVVRSLARRRGRANLGQMLGGLVSAGILLIGALIAATVIFPSVKPVDVLGALGVSSVAIGFAFKDILQNWLAGLLILFRQPFEIGDWIEVDDVMGSVERIETRATMIKTFDGKLVVIPNADLYTDKVTVWTHYPARRSEYNIGIGYADDIDRARDTILDAIKGVEGVLSDPEPQVMEWDLAASWVTLRARWWTDARGALGPRRQVIRAIKLALDDAAIDMPYDTRVILHHDQTEETDGDRTRQREGWPAGNDAPRPRAEVEMAENDRRPRAAE
ncbi:MAG: mechanosensitive ion channel family protein [Pseudomonadota bacterium]